MATTRIDFDVPEVGEGNATMSYAAELGRRSEGYSQYFGYRGQFYAAVPVYDGDASRDGWPEDPWRPSSALYDRLWLSLLADLLENRTAKGENPNLHAILGALAGEYEEDRLAAFEALEMEAAEMKSVPETEEDFEDGRRRASRVLGDLIIYRRQLHIRTGQPCYAVHVKGTKARIAVETTDVHMRLRAASFENPIHYPLQRSNDRIDGLKHYFAIEEREAMLAFVEAWGATVVGTAPRAGRQRWADHDETMDGLELDRIARVALHEIALAFASSTVYALPSVLLREKRAFFDAFYDLKEFLDERHDPEETCEELATKFMALHELAARERSAAHVLISRPLKEFLDRATSRFRDRRISPIDFLPNAGSLPQPL
ncbi:hypothetical protein HFN89_00860 [Rhizobium laguerreae]|nr:hypothetical protein [Rhizobium laguerreae]